MNPIDLTGHRFGRWQVIDRAVQGRAGRTAWNCVCDCGNKKVVVTKTLRNGISQSCGCLMKEIVSATNIKHGHYRGRKRSPEYSVWVGIKQRCFDSNMNIYPYYGGRGITMCDRWKNDFLLFLKDMGTRPSKNHSIDRIDNNGNYEPGNCKWSTRSEQMRNKRNSRYITINGETLHTKEWAEKLGIKAATINMRINRGWSLREAVLGRI